MGVSTLAMDIAAFVWYDATIIGKLSKVRESRKRENVAKTERMFYHSYRQQTLEGKTMKGKEFDEKQVLIRCIAKKLETASLARVREIFIFVQYALK